MHRHRTRLATTLAGMSVLVAAAGVAVPAVPAAAQAPAACEVAYQARSWTEQSGSGGFVASLTITNLGEPVTAWELGFTLPPGQSVEQGWSATWPASGTTGEITASSMPWNGVLGTGDSTRVGFFGHWSGEFTEPDSFFLNGTPCVGDRQPPEVAVTAPTSGPILLQGAVTLVAEASSPTGAVQRVEFYVNDALVGADTTAPYCVHAPSGAFGFSGNTVLARAIDDGNPPLSADSAPVENLSGVTLPPPLPTHIIQTPSFLEIHAGSSEVVNIRLNVEATAEVEMVAFGDAGLTVTPSSFTLDPSNWDTGQDVTVQAPLAAEGMLAGFNATVADPEIGSGVTRMMVVGADPTDTCGQV